MKNLKILIIILSILLITPQTQAKNKKVETPQPIEYINIKWWENYNDPILSDYMMSLYNNNQDLKIATIKTKQSQQIMKQAFANQLPQLYFNGYLQRDMTASDQRFGEVLISDYNQAHYYLPLTMSYEVDIWGENYLKTKSFKKQIEMTKQDEKSAYIAMTSNFASNYYTLIGLDKLIENQNSLVKIEENIVKLEEQKYNSGLCPLSELLSERQTLTQMTERLNSLKERQDITINQLIAQLGDRYITQIQRNPYDSVTTIKIPEEISTEYIASRPDIKKAELYIEKTGLDVKVAQRDFLPKFRIYGQVGFNAFDWCRIFAPHTFLSNVGIAPSLDLFTGGFKKAKLKYNKLEYEKALQIYDKAIITSIQELNDALMSAKTSDMNYQKSVERYNIELEKLELANKKFSSGGASKLENLKDQQYVILSEESKIINNINRVISSINIYKATGGQDYTSEIL